MSIRQVTSDSYLRMLLILFGGMLMAQVSLVGIFGYIYLTEEKPSDPEMLSIMIYLVPAVATALLGMSFILPAKLNAKAASKPTLSEKLRGYQTAFIFKMAMLEVPSLLSCIAFYLTGEFFFLAVNVVSIGLVAMNFPSRSKVIDALQLTGQDARTFSDGSAVVMEDELSTVD